MRKFVTIVLALVMACMLAGTAWADGPATQDLKLNDAITQALLNSKSLQKADLDIDKNQAQLDLKQQAMGGFTPASGTGNGVALDTAFYNLMSSTMNWEMSKKTKSSTEDQIVLDTCNKYWTVQKDVENVKCNQLSLDKMKISLQRVRAMVNLGMTPSEAPSGSSPAQALTTAEGNVATAQSNLETAQNALNTAYEALNQAIGLDADARPALTDEIQYEPIQDTTPDYAVQKALQNSPAIWSAQQQADLAKVTDEQLAASGQYSGGEVQEITIREANINVASQKDSLELSTRNIFYSLKNYEAGIAAAEKAVAQCQEALRVAKIELQLGMVTKETVAQSEATLESANYQLMNLKISYSYWKLALQKPWAVSAGGSQS